MDVTMNVLLSCWNTYHTNTRTRTHARFPFRHVPQAGRRRTFSVIAKGKYKDEGVGGKNKAGPRDAERDIASFLQVQPRLRALPGWEPIK